MSQIGQVFEGTRGAGRIALMPYLAVGYPSVAATVELAPALAAAGADIFELGVPYSDPLADGATVQHATQVALRNGVTPQVCLDVAAEIHRKVNVPLVLMSYYNPIARYGDAAFAAAAAGAGVSGLIVPDLPPEEAEDLQASTRAHGLDLIYMVAPTSTDERLRLVARSAQGFIYCVALAGVTGARSQLADSLPAYLTRVRQTTSVPLAVGFGVSRPEHVQTVARYADGAIVASALIDRIAALPASEQVSAAAAFVSDLAAATERPEV
jgi:tryptophan synthase alpha chain